MDSSMFNNKRIKSLAAVVWVLAMSSSWAQTAPSSVAQAASCPALLNHTFPRLQDEKPQSLCQYSGKVILVVNTASYCGFTSQYKGLEAVYSQYKDKGLVVLGFPSNDFAQEKVNNKDIADFCESTFGVKASAAYRELRRVQHKARLNEAPTQVPQAELQKERDAILTLWRAVFPEVAKGLNSP